MAHSGSIVVSMRLAHRVRLDPTPTQQEYFRRACGVARFAYNWALAEWQRQHAAGEKPSEAALRKQLNALKDKRFPWMREGVSRRELHVMK
jgi:putative transposase